MINNYQNYLKKLQNIAIAKVDTKKRRILLYDKKILVFKKYGYNVVLEMFIRIRDIQKFSYVSTTDNNNSLEIKLAKRPNISKRNLIIPFKYPSSAFAVNNFVSRLNEILKEMNPQHNPCYIEWEPEDPLYCYEEDEDLNTVAYKFPDAQLEEELKTILQGQQSWISYIEEHLPPDSPLREDSKFVNCDGDIQTVMDTGVKYYDFGTDKDYKAAFECFRLAAGSGDIYAALYLGTCYLYGRGTAKNLDYAMHWLCIAAKQYKAAYPLIHESCQQMYGNIDEANK